MLPLKVYNTKIIYLGSPFCIGVSLGRHGDLIRTTQLPPTAVARTGR